MWPAEQTGKNGTLAGKPRSERRSLMATTGTVTFRIMGSDLVNHADNAQLNWLMSMMKERWSHLDEEKADSFSMGETVKFPIKRRGITQINHGVVIKINRKTVRVRTAVDLWKVSPHILEHDDGPY